MSSIVEVIMAHDHSKSQMAQKIISLEKEKERRIHWQGLAYAAMNTVDKILNKKIGRDNTTEDEFKDDLQIVVGHLVALRQSLNGIEILQKDDGKWLHINSGGLDALCLLAGNKRESDVGIVEATIFHWSERRNKLLEDK